MSPARRRQANPNLGAYFGIVASAFVSLVVGLAMFEQLGWKQTLLAQAMMLVPLAFYLGIAVGARTLNVEDFFVCGRRVPPGGAPGVRDARENSACRTCPARRRACMRTGSSD